MASLSTLRGAMVLKPDALRGSYATCGYLRSRDYFYALRCGLANVLPEQKDFKCRSSIWRATAALEQVCFRARAEASFAEPLLDRSLCTERLAKCAVDCEAIRSSFTLLDIVTNSAEALGLHVLASGHFTFTASDVRFICADAIRREPALFRPLVSYLCRGESCLLLLEGEQSFAGLEWVKTYVRYFFRYQRGRGHQVRNLIHAGGVAEAEHIKLLVTEWLG